MQHRTGNPHARGRGRIALKGQPDGSEVAGAAAGRYARKTVGGDGIDEDFFLGHEEEQAQELRRAQKHVLQRKDSRKRQRQQRPLVRQRHTHLRKTQPLLERLFPKGSEQLRTLPQQQQQELLQGQLRALHRQRRRQQQAGKQRRKEDRGLQPQQRFYDKEEDGISSVRKGVRGVKQRRLVAAASPVSEQSGSRASLIDTSAGNESEPVIRRERNRSRTELRRTLNACSSDNSSSGGSEGECQEEKEVDMTTQSESDSSPPGCADEYMFFKGSTRSRSLPEVFGYKADSAVHSRAEELRQQRAKDQRELSYLERQLGLAKPGVCEEKKKKLISKEFAVLGLDEDFLECLDTVFDSREGQAESQPDPGRHSPVAHQLKSAQHDPLCISQEQQQKYRGKKRTSGKSEGEEEVAHSFLHPLPSGARAKSRKRRAVVELGKVARRACMTALKDGAEGGYREEVEETCDKAAGDQSSAEAEAGVDLARAAAADAVTATKIASRARRALPEPVTKASHKGKRERQTPAPSTGRRAVGDIMKKAASSTHAAPRGEKTFATGGSSGGVNASTAAKEHRTGLEHFAAATGGRPEEAGKERILLAGGNTGDLSASALAEFSCTTSVHQRSIDSQRYLPPHVRRRLEQDKLMQEKQRHHKHAHALLAAANHAAAEGLRLRLRGLLNRASEGNVEVVLQQVAAAIKETASQLCQRPKVVADASFGLTDVSVTLLQLPSSGIEEEELSPSDLRKKQQLRRVREHFMLRVCEAVALLFVEGAIENKFSVAALVATQTALCCALSLLLGTQLLRCFLGALGDCFCRFFPAALLSDSSSSESSSSSRHSNTGAHGDSEERVCGGSAGCADVTLKKKKVGVNQRRRAAEVNKEEKDEKQTAIRTAAMYTRHVIAAICFLFDYGALPATVYLQLLERLTVTAKRLPSHESGAEGVIISTGGLNGGRVDSGGSNLCVDAEGRGTLRDGGSAVLSEFQVECLLLALRLGGRRLRSESPLLFKAAWLHLMAQAAPGLHGGYLSPAPEGRTAGFFPAETEGTGEAEAAGKLPSAGDVQNEEKPAKEREADDVLEQLKLRFEWRAAATGRTAAQLQRQQIRDAGQRPAVPTAHGRLRFLVRELQELKNNRNNSLQVSSSGATQDSMRRWLQTSATLRGAVAPSASSHCCSALLEGLGDITWRDIEEKSILSASTSPRPAGFISLREGSTDCARAIGGPAMNTSQALTKASDVFGENERRDGAGAAGGDGATARFQHAPVAQLAAKLRFHTENQKAIFFSLMSASSPNEAVQQLSQIKSRVVSPKQHLVDVVAVVLHSCLQEKTFNPFYAIVLAHLCGCCCCGSAAAPLHSADGSARRNAQRRPLDARSCGVSAGSSGRFQYGGLYFSACALPTPDGGVCERIAVEKLRTGCACYTLPQKEAMKYKRVLQRGLAAQTSAAHAFPLRRLLHLAKVEAFLIRLGILELRLIRFLNFEEAAKEAGGGHMGLAGKLGSFLKELCTEVLCDPTQASVLSFRGPTLSSADAAAADASAPSTLPLFFSVCNLPDIREALLSVLQELLVAEKHQQRASVRENAKCSRRMSSATAVKRAIWLLKEAVIGDEE